MLETHIQSTSRKPTAAGKVKGFWNLSLPTLCGMYPPTKPKPLFLPKQPPDRGQVCTSQGFMGRGMGAGIIQVTIFYLWSPESCDYIIIQNIFSPSLKVPGVFSLNMLKSKFPCKLKEQTGSHTQGHRICANIPKGRTFWTKALRLKPSRADSGLCSSVSHVKRVRWLLPSSFADCNTPLSSWFYSL